MTGSKQPQCQLLDVVFIGGCDNFFSHSTDLSQIADVVASKIAEKAHGSFFVQKSS